MIRHGGSVTPTSTTQHPLTAPHTHNHNHTHTSDPGSGATQAA
jgi:hypothetical protein